MPSLWKKQKGSKISRSILDLDTSSHNQHETLIDEDSVSTFKEKLTKKYSKKKQRYKKHNTTITMHNQDYNNYPFQTLNSMMISKFVPQSKIEFIDHDIQTNDQNKENILQNKDIDSDCNDNECSTTTTTTSKNEKKHVFWLCTLMGALVISVLLLYYGIFISGIILTISSLTLKVNMKNMLFPLITRLCTKKTLFGIITRLRKLLRGVKQPEIIKEVILIKKVEENRVSTTIGIESEKGIDIEVIEDEGDNFSKVKVTKHENKDNNNNTTLDSSSCSEEDKIWNEIVTEINSLDQSYSVWPRQNNLISCNSKGKSKNDESSTDFLDQNEKRKKRRKFWKKLVPKIIRKNKNGKQFHEASEDGVEDSETEFEETEIEDVEDTSPVSSDDNDDGEEDFGVVKQRQDEVLEGDKESKYYFRKENKKDTIVKGLIVLLILLVGLIGGRTLAFLMTVVGCVLLNMLKGRFHKQG